MSAGNFEKNEEEEEESDVRCGVLHDEFSNARRFKAAIDWATRDCVPFDTIVAMISKA